MGVSADVQYKSKLLGKLFDSAKRAREKCSYDKYMKELDDYDTTNGNFLPTIGWDKSKSFDVQTFKTQQYKREIGSRLVTSNPKFRAAVKEWAGEGAFQRAQIVEGILNVSVSETDFAVDLRKATDCALGYGRGALRVGMSAKKSVPVCKYYRAKDIWTDAESTNWHQANMLFLRNKSTKYDLADRFPEYRARIYDFGDDECKYGGKCVEWIEVYTLDGCERYENDIGMEVKGKRGRTGPRKYVFIPNSGFLLYDGEWETPFFQETGRQAWPVEFLDFYTRDDSLYPDPPLRPGIPWLKAYNFLQSIMFLKAKRSASEFVAFFKINGIEFDQDSIDSMLCADDPLAVIDMSKAFDTMGGDIPDVRKFFQQFSFSGDLSELQNASQECLNRFEEETGLNQFLYAGEPGTQDRSAAATHLREKNSMSRIDDMVNSFEDFLSKVGRKMAITARFHMDGADVSRYLGEEAGKAWGVLMSPEQMDVNNRVEQMMAEGATDSVDMAYRVAEQVVANGVSFDAFLDETYFDVEAGSTKRKTPAEEQAGIEWMTNQLLPTIAQMGASQTVAMITSKAAKMLGGFDEAEQQSIMQEFNQIAQQQAMMQQQAAIQTPTQ